LCCSAEAAAASEAEAAAQAEAEAAAAAAAAAAVVSDPATLAAKLLTLKVCCCVRPRVAV
jgi:hypothetical protein